MLAIFWTLVAGLRAVAWTDAGQSIVMLVSGVLAVGFAVASIGGVEAFTDKVAAQNGPWLDVPGPGLWSLPTFLALALPWFLFPQSNPQVSQRLFVVADMPDAADDPVGSWLRAGLHADRRELRARRAGDRARA